MPRTALAVALAAALPLVWAGSAAAAPGGLGPPKPQSPSGETIYEIYWVVFAICAVVFVLVEATLVLFALRFRRRRRTPLDAEGPQIHGNTRLEVIWTLIPAVILAGIAVYAIARTPAVQATPERGEALRVRVESHQFYWQYVYPNGVVSLDTLRLPVDRPVSLELVSLDVNHSWWVPELTGKRDAIPGQVNVLSFRPERTGTYDGECAEFCGIQHAVMYTEVEVLEPEAFEAWLAETRAGQQGEALELGQATWEAACAKCHGLEGEGDIGPPIAGSGTLTDREALVQLLETGQNTPDLPGYMPPVGLGWPGFQYDALIAYIESSPTLRGGDEQDGG
ncbi:MAG TPA: cytochrome c oxidase subunit II [Longimicrobiales bacterium]|nr:cytochrome c oxidase subunit II [Longimicrobiales bacterium]